jgi:hypothetical protein
MSKLKKIGDHCIICGCNTHCGSGNFVNRIPADDGEKEGYMCAGCQCRECDRCKKQVLDWETSELTGEITCEDCMEKEAVSKAHAWDALYESISLKGLSDTDKALSAISIHPTDTEENYFLREKMDRILREVNDE